MTPPISRRTPVLLTLLAGLAAGPAADERPAVRTAAVAAARAARGIDVAADRATHDCSDTGYHLRADDIAEWAALDRVAGAVRAKFGDGVAEAFAAIPRRQRAEVDWGLTPEAAAHGTVTLRGDDRADLEVPSGSRPGLFHTHRLHKVGGTWKLVDTSYLTAEDKPDERWAHDARVVKVLDGIAAGVPAGTFATAQDVYDAVLDRSATADGRPPSMFSTPLPGTAGAATFGTGHARRPAAAAPASAPAPTFADVFVRMGRDRDLIRIMTESDLVKRTVEQQKRWQAEIDAEPGVERAVTDKHADELPAVRQHAERVQEIVRVTHGQEDPSQLLREYQANEVFYRDLAAVVHAHEQRLAAILTPEQRAAIGVTDPAR